MDYHEHMKQYYDRRASEYEHNEAFREEPSEDLPGLLHVISQQRVDAPAAVHPDPDAFCQQTRIEFDDVFGRRPCQLGSSLLRDRQAQPARVTALALPIRRPSYAIHPTS
jgi:hypothetical protein